MHFSRYHGTCHRHGDMISMDQIAKLNASLEIQIDLLIPRGVLETSVATFLVMYFWHHSTKVGITYKADYCS